MLALAVIASLAALEDRGVVEQTAVKNRLFTVDSRVEVGVSAGFTLIAKLTEHTVFDVSVAYNLYESLAVEGLSGYAYSRRTALANDLTSLRARGGPPISPISG